jgi:putative membrane protein
MILEKKIPLSYWFDIIKWDILIVSIFSSLIFYSSRYLTFLKISISIGTFLGTAIALLLSFKLSQSYDRWWEARRIWGSIVNDSRTLVTQLKLFTENKNKKLTDRMAYRQIAWCYSLSQNLRAENAAENIAEFISADELNSINEQNNPTLALLDNQTQDLSTLHKKNFINDFQQIQINSTLVRICASMGQAERIKNTNFPKTYRQTLYFFIYIFLVTLSLSLTEMNSFVEIPLLVFISLPFFLLEKIAFNIQDPFENRPTDIAMTSISKNIEISIKQLLKLENIPDPITTDNFYIL